MPSKQKQLSFRLTEDEYKQFQAFLLLDGTFEFNNAAAKYLFLKGLALHIRTTSLADAFEDSAKE